MPDHRITEPICTSATTGSNSHKTIEDMMGALPEDEQAKLTGGNAAHIWRLGDQA